MTTCTKTMTWKSLSHQWEAELPQCPSRWKHRRQSQDVCVSASSFLPSTPPGTCTKITSTPLAFVATSNHKHTQFKTQSHWLSTQNVAYNQKDSGQVNSTGYPLWMQEMATTLALPQGCRSKEQPIKWPTVTSQKDNGHCRINSAFLDGHMTRFVEWKWYKKSLSLSHQRQRLALNDYNKSLH